METPRLTSNKESCAKLRQHLKYQFGVKWGSTAFMGAVMIREARDEILGM